MKRLQRGDLRIWHSYSHDDTAIVEQLHFKSIPNNIDFYYWNQKAWVDQVNEDSGRVAIFRVKWKNQ